MSDYTADHASALADVAAAGTAVTFTLTGPGTYDPTTGLYTTPTSTTSSGYAIGASGGLKEDRLQYEALGLTQSEGRTLFYVPSTYGDSPSLGATVTWAGAVRTVKSATALAPNGSAIAWRVVVA